MGAISEKKGDDGPQKAATVETGGAIGTLPPRYFLLGCSVSATIEWRQSHRIHWEELLMKTRRGIVVLLAFALVGLAYLSVPRDAEAQSRRFFRSKSSVNRSYSRSYRARRGVNNFLPPLYGRGARVIPVPTYSSTRPVNRYSGRYSHRL